MRFITKKMNHKRGCISYCADTKMVKHGTRVAYYCKHKCCPYHELDEYESYADYLEATEDIDITKLLREK